jgi:hypothetical protein
MMHGPMEVQGKGIFPPLSLQYLPWRGTKFTFADGVRLHYRGTRNQFPKRDE